MSGYIEHAAEAAVLDAADAYERVWCSWRDLETESKAVYAELVDAHWVMLRAVRARRAAETSAS